MRDLTDRLAALDRQAGAAIWRGHIYKLAQAWGAAKAAHMRVWAALMSRFRAARYEDLPAARYDRRGSGAAGAGDLGL